MTARLATGRAVEPHLTRTVGGRAVRGVRAEDWPSLGIAERDLRLMREGMWAVVNEEGGTGRAAGCRRNSARWPARPGPSRSAG